MTSLSSFIDEQPFAFNGQAKSKQRVLHSKVVGTTTQSLQKLSYYLRVILGVIHPYDTVWLIYE